MPSVLDENYHSFETYFIGEKSDPGHQNKRHQNKSGRVERKSSDYDSPADFEILERLGQRANRNRDHVTPQRFENPGRTLERKGEGCKSKRIWMAVAFGFIVLSAILIGLIAGHYIRELFSEEQSAQTTLLKTQSDPCLPNPCGSFSICKSEHHTAFCTCQEGYLGEPPHCQNECLDNAECPSNLACLRQKCRDPCSGFCGANATCKVLSNSPVCRCKHGYTGDPKSKCTRIRQTSSIFEIGEYENHYELEDQVEDQDVEEVEDDSTICTYPRFIKHDGRIACGVKMVERLDQESSKRKCAMMDAFLPDIRSMEENNYYQKYMNLNQWTEMWIDVRLDDNPVSRTYSSGGSPITFTNWNEGEPNNVKNEEDCVEMHLNGKWFDNPCRFTFPTICEKIF